MKNIKNFEEFIGYDPDSLSINDVIKNSIKEEDKWKEIIKKDFEDLPVYHKGKNNLKIDLRLDSFHNYDYTNHKPCVYFRVGNGEYDFLPMIISDKPYIPYSFEQTINDDELLWVYDWVKTNKNTLLKYADEKIGYKEFMSIINKGEAQGEIDEGKSKIQTKDTGLTRVIWIGPYDSTGHYLRIKIQNPKTSHNSQEWASLTIPELKLIPDRERTDISAKELKDIEKFAINNKDCLDDFAKDKIDFETLQDKIEKNIK